MIPSFLLSIWFMAAAALGIAGGAIYSAHRWIRDSWGWDDTLKVSVFQPALGYPSAGLLLLAICLACIALLGRPIVITLLRAIRPSDEDQQPDPRESPHPDETKEIRRPDGSMLHLESYGPVEGAPLICTHGWGLNSQEWNYLKANIPSGYRLVVWDLPGTGDSTKPHNNDLSVEKFANDLQEVIRAVSRPGKPALLVGHSIGGMILLTFCRLFPTALHQSVGGLVLVHTTPTNPVRTTSGSAILSALEAPVLKPLCYLTILLSPLLRVINWMAYANGSVHLLDWRSSFAGTETWQQIDFSARFHPRVSPAVLARGMLGMMNYDATAVLPEIPVPTLVVTADQDTTTKPSAGRAIHQVVPAATLIELAPAKHLGLIEHHYQFLGRLEAFCSRVRASAAL